MQVGSCCPPSTASRAAPDGDFARCCQAGRAPRRPGVYSPPPPPPPQARIEVGVPYPGPASQGNTDWTGVEGSVSLGRLPVGGRVSFPFHKQPGALEQERLGGRKLTTASLGMGDERAGQPHPQSLRRLPLRTPCRPRAWPPSPAPLPSLVLFLLQRSVPHLSKPNTKTSFSPKLGLAPKALCVPPQPHHNPSPAVCPTVHTHPATSPWRVGCVTASSGPGSDLGLLRGGYGGQPPILSWVLTVCQAQEIT